MANRKKAEDSDILSRLDLQTKGYAVITLHRPSNVDDMDTFEQIISAFEVIEKDMKLIFPIHPRTRKNIKAADLGKRVKGMENLILLDPIGYLDFLCLMSNSALVITDSGGIQEETTILGVPCMTLRENTERPVTITEGTNRLVHVTTDDILKNYEQIKESKFDICGRIPKFWDGKAAQRIAAIIADISDLK
jgi:UDP-N-acetylglucosamine 2-epimerase (non-hydrolysing)